MTDLLLYIPWGRGNMSGWLWLTLTIGAIALWLIEKYNGRKKRRTRPYSWVRSDRLLPKTKRQVLLYIDDDLKDSDTNTFHYRTAFIEGDGCGGQVFVAPGGWIAPSKKVWWRDLIPPEKAKHQD